MSSVPVNLERDITERDARPHESPSQYGSLVITPEQAADAINERFGLHPGFRTLHAKGTLCRGTFTATDEASGLTRAAHMQGPPVDVTARFSNGSGDPGAPDYDLDVRGMATTFHLADGSRTDIVAQTSPRFPVRSAEAFIELVRAGEPGLARLWRLPAFLLRHPGALPALRAAPEATRPPPSYAACGYYAIHAYRWVDSRGGSRHVRYRWVAQASDAAISRREARERGPDYLQAELRERLAREPARFTLQLQLAADGDPVDDPVAAWPDERQIVVAGTLELADAASGPADADGDALVFDPARVTDGIELSDDPILRFRPQAYSVSHQRRTSAP